MHLHLPPQLPQHHGTMRPLESSDLTQPLRCPGLDRAISLSRHPPSSFGVHHWCPGRRAGPGASGHQTGPHLGLLSEPLRRCPGCWAPVTMKHLLMINQVMAIQMKHNGTFISCNIHMIYRIISAWMWIYVYTGYRDVDLHAHKPIYLITCVTWHDFTWACVFNMKSRHTSTCNMWSPRNKLDNSFQLSQKWESGELQRLDLIQKVQSIKLHDAEFCIVFSRLSMMINSAYWLMMRHS